jgi:hypothetical protein
MTDRIPVNVAARIMGVIPQFIYQEMREGRMDLGYVTGNKRKQYIIFRAKLEKMIGRKLTEEDLKE